MRFSNPHAIPSAKVYESDVCGILPRLLVCVGRLARLVSSMPTWAEFFLRPTVIAAPLVVPLMAKPHEDRILMVKHIVCYMSAPLTMTFNRSSTRSPKPKDTRERPECISSSSRAIPQFLCQAKYVAMATIVCQGI